VAGGGAEANAGEQDRLFLEEEEWMERNKVVAPALRKGDALIYDHRACHRGTRNLSMGTTRPMLHLLYTRPWFKEHINFGTERLFPS
jgi:ectoine hydroxylase-related dioxygenase (phytanoyl-CoA dioxygenase family)